MDNGKDKMRTKILLTKESNQDRGVGSINDLNGGLIMNKRYALTQGLASISHAAVNLSTT